MKTGWTEKELKLKMIGVEFGPVHEPRIAWVDASGMISLPAFTLTSKDLREILRKAESWLQARRDANE